MIEKIIASLKEDLIKNSDAETLYNQYVEKKSLEEQIVNNEEKVKELEEEKRNLEERLYSYNVFQSLFKRKDILAIKQQIKNLEIDIEETRKNVEQVKEICDKIQLTEGNLKIIEQYVRVLDMEKDYSSGRYDEVVDGVLEVFNSDFRNLISFCKEKNISLNFIDYDADNKAKVFGMDFIDKFTQMPVPEKYSDLNQLCLVRKVKMEAMPKGDMVIPAPSVGSINEVSKTGVTYDGKRYEDIEFEHPRGHLTISWYLNACVADHKDGSWADCDVVIIQPMNEKLYNDVAGLAPVDIIFEDAVELENYFVICDSEEKKKEIEVNNNDVTVFVLKKEDYACLPSRLGYYQLFRDYDGRVDGSYKKIEDLYEENFLEKYPKFITHTVAGPSNTIHNYSYLSHKICQELAKLDFVINKASDEENFDVALRKILEAFSSGSFGISELHSKNISIEKIFVQGDKKYTSFLSKLIAMDNNKFEPQAVFNLLIDGVTINELNKDSLLKMKEEVILTILKYNAEVENNRDADLYFDKRYENLVYRLFVLRKIVLSDVVNKKRVSPVNYKQILEYCDFSKLGELCSNIVYSDFNKDKNMDECWEEIFEALDININRLSTKILNFNLVREQNSINDFIDKFIYISKIKDKNKMMQEIDNIFGDLLNEDGMEIFRLWAKDYSRASDLENKLLYLSLPIAYIMSNDLELNRQENKEIKR